MQPWKNGFPSLRLLYVLDYKISYISQFMDVKNL